MRADNQILGEAVVRVQLHIRLRDVITGLLHRGQIDDLFGDLSVDDAAVWAFDEAIFVYTRKSREAVDEADIRAFRRLNRAYPAVVSRGHVGDLEARALAGHAP